MTVEIRCLTRRAVSALSFKIGFKTLITSPAVMSETLALPISGTTESLRLARPLFGAFAVVSPTFRLNRYDCFGGFNEVSDYRRHTFGTRIAPGDCGSGVIELRTAASVTTGYPPSPMLTRQPRIHNLCEEDIENPPPVLSFTG